MDEVTAVVRPSVLSAVRAASAYVLLSFGVGTLRLAMRCLEREHPVRVYLAGALALSEDVVFNACRGQRRGIHWGPAWMTATVGVMVWTVVDDVLPFDLSSGAVLALLLP